MHHVPVCLVLLATLGTAHTGFDEGFSAYQRRDFTTALREWRPLAERGSAAAASQKIVIVARLEVYGN